MTDRELMQMALDALECKQPLLKNALSSYGISTDEIEKMAIETLRARLAQDGQEPVAWITDREEVHFDKEDARRHSDGFIQPLYTAPPQREWQGLTDEEVESAFMANTCCDDLVVYEHIARAIEAKLKEKNK